MEAAQLDLITGGVSDADVMTLRAWLAIRGWQTRAQIATGTGWHIRKISVVADLLGTDIILQENLGDAALRALSIFPSITVDLVARNQEQILD